MNTKPSAQQRIPEYATEGTGCPLITVVYPLFDIRGSAVDALRTWTQKQTLSRALYCVHVLFSEERGPIPHTLLEVLADGDRLLHVPDGNDAAMWNAGAAQARTPWLVLVEGHSLADPRCLEQTAAWISAGYGVVGNFAILHNDNHLMARLAEKWFAQIQSIWRSPEGWPRVHRTGFAIRADVFSRAGGFASEYGQFAPALLSARLHASRVQVGYITGASVLHLDDVMVADHHYDTADYAAGEIACRSQEEQVFFERYFGHSDIWSNRLCRSPYMLWLTIRALAVTGLTHPRHLLALGSVAARLVPAWLQETSAERFRQHAIIKFIEFAIGYLPLPESLRWKWFVSAHKRVVAQTQRDWVRKHGSIGAPRKAPVSPSIDVVTPCDLSGVYGLEKFEAKNFRWTWPVFVLRVEPSANSLQIHIDTGGLRGDPLDCVIAVVSGGWLLPRTAMSAESGVLSIALSGLLASAAGEGVFVICKPLLPSRYGFSDRRSLGLPVFAITFGGVK